MTTAARSRRASLARGAGVAAMFFYPLTSSLATQPFYLHWRPIDATVLLASLTAVAAVATLMLMVIERVRSAAMASALTLILVAVPFLSFALHLTRELKLVDEVGRMRLFLVSHRGLALFFVGGVALIAASALFYRADACRAVVRGALLVPAPVALLSCVVVARSFTLDTVTHTAPAVAMDVAPDSTVEPASVFILIFDQLSYAELVDENREVRPSYPHFRDFAATARRFHQATSPGSHTGTALPSILLGTREIGAIEARGSRAVAQFRDGRRTPLDLASRNLLVAARARGMRTALVGWYFPYCDLMRGSLDRCAAFSAYNTSTLDGPSPFDALLTNVILWPHEAPLLGRLKNAAACAAQAGMVERTESFVRETIREPGPRFVFAHFSIPHWPFAFAGTSYRPAAEPYGDSAIDYAAQLRYTDIVLGRLLDELRDSGRLDRSHVIVTSDHENRGRADMDHVPVLWKPPGQDHGEDVYEDTRVEQILWALVGSDASTR